VDNNIHLNASSSSHRRRSHCYMMRAWCANVTSWAFAEIGIVLAVGTIRWTSAGHAVVCAAVRLIRRWRCGWAAGHQVNAQQGRLIAWFSIRGIGSIYTCCTPSTMACSMPL
jgi:hypothetical protein